MNFKMGKLQANNVINFGRAIYCFYLFVRGCLPPFFCSVFRLGSLSRNRPIRVQSEKKDRGQILCPPKMHRVSEEDKLADTQL